MRCKSLLFNGLLISYLFCGQSSLAASTLNMVNDRHASTAGNYYQSYYQRTTATEGVRMFRCNRWGGCFRHHRGVAPWTHGAIVPFAGMLLHNVPYSHKHKCEAYFRGTHYFGIVGRDSRCHINVLNRWVGINDYYIVR